MSASIPARSIGRRFIDAMSHPEHGWKTTHFWGPVANWGLVAAAVTDAVTKPPDVISMKMTCTMAAYSAVFMRFAWMVQPRNHLLFACHLFNVGAQLYQLQRGYKHQLAHKVNAAVADARIEGMAAAEAAGAAALRPAAAAPSVTSKDLQFNPVIAALATAGTLGLAVAGGPIKRALLSNPNLPATVQKAVESPVGPFTIHGWAPMFKWLLSISNILDFNRPIESVSMAQQTALTATGFIWARYSLVITPKNYSLFLVNFCLGLTGAYQLARKAIAGTPAPVKAI